MKYYEFKKVLISTVRQTLRRYLLLKILNIALSYVNLKQNNVNIHQKKQALVVL